MKSNAEIEADILVCVGQVTGEGWKVVPGHHVLQSEMQCDPLGAAGIVSGEPFHPTMEGWFGFAEKRWGVDWVWVMSFEIGYLKADPTLLPARLNEDAYRLGARIRRQLHG